MVSIFNRFTMADNRKRARRSRTTRGVLFSCRLLLQLADISHDVGNILRG